MEALLEKWARFVARWPLLIIVVWIILVAVALKCGPSINDVAAMQHATSSLPASAPSMQADHIYDTKFAAGQASVNKETDVLVLTDPRGISPQDVAQASHIEAWLMAPGRRPAHLLTVTGPGPQAPAGFFESSDHQALRLVLTWDTTNGPVPDASLQAVDAYLSQQHLPPGGTLGLTGSAPINYDLNTGVFSSSGSVGSLLGILIILVVLGIVYRSPLAVLVPLITVGMAFGLSLPLIAWLGQTFGVAVASFSLQYVAFVLLGVGTNYGVFMLSRYREEIRRASQNDRAARQEALARTVGHVGESIASSASTVVIATAIMGLAQLYELRVTGPAVAVGVACLLLAGLSLLPALMALCGRALFWPAQPRPGTLSDATTIEKGIWARVGRLVTTHPRVVALVATIVLLPLAISTVMIQPSFDELKSLPASSPAVQAFNAYQAHFNNAAQVQVILTDPGHDLRQAQYSGAIAQVATTLSRVPHVTAVQAPSTASQSAGAQTFYATDASAVAITLSLNVDPSSLEARQAVDAISTTAAQAQHGTLLGGAQVLVSGQSSTVRDEAMQFGSDFTLVVILVCIAIYVILALLVRSVTAPVYLLATIALSTLVAVGVTNIVYHDILGQPLFSIVPIFAFVFLVSLGEDFNILTIARIREEVQKLGQRRGIATAIALTGGVVSSRGLVMAASFSRLATNAIVEVAELGFTVVIGILLDTFVVRPLLVPAIATMLGRWNWVWPHSSLWKSISVEGTAFDGVTTSSSRQDTQPLETATREAEVQIRALSSGGYSL
jgi:putative drug exporter of the RND superfamily